MYIEPIDNLSNESDPDVVMWCVRESCLDECSEWIEPYVGRKFWMKWLSKDVWCGPNKMLFHRNWLEVA